VLQHDTDLFPHQCGGPLFDISGNAVGLNIARAARITSYAIPANAVLRVFEELKNKGDASLLKEAS
jgi:serine protease Do